MICGSDVLRTERTCTDVCHVLGCFQYAQEGDCMVFYMVLSVSRVKFIFRFPENVTETLFFELAVVLFSFLILCKLH